MDHQRDLPESIPGDPFPPAGTGGPDTGVDGGQPGVYEEFREAFDALRRERSGGREAALLALFDFFEGWRDRAGTQPLPSPGAWAARGGHRGPTGPECLAEAGTRLAEVAGRAGLRDAEGFARSFHVLLHGLDTAARQRDPRAAAHARRIAVLLVQEHLPDLP